MQGARHIRRNRFITALLLIMLLTAGCFREHTSFQPVAVNGTIDLSAWNPPADRSVELNGEWHFHPDTLLDKADLLQGGVLAAVPGQWKKIPGYQSRHSRPDFGYGTYQLTLRGLRKEYNTPLLLRLHEIRSSYTLTVSPLGNTSAQPVTLRVGRIGSTAATAIPQYKPHILLVPTGTDSCRITLQVANFRVNHGGIKTPIILGLSKQVLKDLNGERALVFMILGILIFMGIHYISLFVNMRKGVHHLLFGCFGLSIAAYFTLNSWIIYDLLTTPNSTTFELLLRFTYLLVIVSQMLFITFIARIFPQEFHRVPLLIFGGISALFLPTFMLPFYRFEYLFQYYLDMVLLSHLYIAGCLIAAVINKRNGSLTSLLGYAVIFFTITNDILYEQYLITTMWMLPFGLVAFFFCQSLTLSKQSAKAYREAEYLTHNLEFEVKRKTEELNTLYQELIDAEKYKSIAVLTSSVSHEILNPLMGIEGPLDVVRRELASASHSQRAQKAIGFIHQNLERIRHTVETLRALNRSSLDISDSVSFVEIATPILELMRERLPAKITLAASIPDNCMLTTNRGALSQILIALLTNAAEAVGDAGEIHLSARSDTETMIITIADTGCGIEESALPRIFDFAYTTKTKSQGTGIGLFIVKNLADKIGATLRVVSTVGEGTKFEIAVTHA